MAQRARFPKDTRSYTFRTLHWEFGIGNRSYIVGSMKSGYSIKTGSEEMSFQYRRGTCHINISNRGVKRFVSYDFSKLPKMRFQVQTERGTETFAGDNQEVGRWIMQARLRSPVPEGLKVFLDQLHDKGFRKTLRSVLMLLIPYEDYYPYFRKPVGSRAPTTEAARVGGGGAMDDACASMCAMCALDPELFFVACAACIACLSGDTGGIRGGGVLR
jgi:hypothetical protein